MAQSPSIRTIPQRQWAIAPAQEPWPDRVNNAAGMGSHRPYDRVCAALEARGFVLAVDTLSVSLYTLRWEQKEESVHHHSLWYHPAGVLVKTSSYGRPPHLDGMNAYAQVLVRSGRNAYMAAHLAICGGGSTNPRRDGTFVMVRNENFNQGGSGFDAWLATLQQHGRLLPFEQWSPGHMPHMGAEDWLALRARPELVGLEEKDIRLRLQAEAQEAQATIMRTWPESLRQAFEDDEKVLPRTGGPAHWGPIEHGLDVFSENLAEARQPWPDEATRVLHTTWSEVAMGERDEDPKAWRASDTTKAGNSLWLMLLMADQSPDNQKRLLDLLERMEPEVLARWCTRPDASGYTLPLRVLQRSLMRDWAARMTEDHDPLFHERLLDTVSRRVGLAVLGKGLLTERRSVLGLLAEQPEPHDHEKAGVPHARTAFGKLVAWIDQHDLPWHAVARWEDPAPRGMTVRRGAAPRHAFVGMAAKEALSSLLTAADQPMLVRWEQRLLHREMSDTTTTRAKPRV